MAAALHFVTAVLAMLGFPAKPSMLWCVCVCVRVVFLRHACSLCVASSSAFVSAVDRSTGPRWLVGFCEGGDGGGRRARTTLRPQRGHRSSLDSRHCTRVAGSEARRRPV